MFSKNQLKSCHRNHALMMITGMITRLKAIKNQSTDTAVKVRTDNAISTLENLGETIRDTNYESWKA